MSVFDLSWHFLKAGRMPDWSSTDRGYDEDPHFDYMFDLDPVTGERVSRKDGSPLSASVAEGDEFQSVGGKRTQPSERVDAPSLDYNQILRLTKPQLDELMQNIQNEIQRRETKRANKNVAVVNQHSPTMMSNDPTSSEGAEWIKNNAWAFEGG